MIRRRRRTRILAESSPALASELAELVRREREVQVVDRPHQGLVMCQMRETARNSRFYLGEALMCECRVRVGGSEGTGAVLGSDTRLAEDMAVLDAVLSEAEETPSPRSSSGAWSWPSASSTRPRRQGTPRC